MPEKLQITHKDLVQYTEQCEQDPVFFIKNFLGLNISPAQIDLVQSMHTKPLTVAIFARQTGKSTAAAAFIVWALMFGKGKVINEVQHPENILVAAPAYQQAKIIFNKVRDYITRNELMRTFVEGDMTMDRIAVKNGNVCSIVSAGINSQIRGASPTRLIMDESQDIADDVMNAKLLPMTTTTKASITKIGTPNSRNHFYLSAYEDASASLIVQPYNKCPFVDNNLIESLRSDKGGTMPIPLWRQEYNCFSPETLITTNTGVKEISKITTNDHVLSHMCKFRKVLGIKSRLYSGQFITITTGYCNIPIRVTPEHPFLVKKTRTCYRWVLAKNLKTTDMLVLPKFKSHKAKTAIQIADYFNVSKHQNSWGVIASKNRLHKRKIIKVNAEFMRLLGYYISEGSTGAKKRQVIFSFGVKEDALHNDVQYILRNLLGLDSKLQKINNTVNVICNSSVLAEILENLVGRGAANKQLPAWVMYLHSRLLREFIQAYWEGDGCHHISSRKVKDKRYPHLPAYNMKTDTYVATTVSRTLAFQIRDILIKLGIQPSVNITHGHIAIFKKKGSISRTILHKDKYTISYRKQSKFERYQTRRFLTIPIKQISINMYSGPVFNLQVEKENSYSLINCAVHNCEFLEMESTPFPSMMVRRCLGDYSYTTEEDPMPALPATGGDYVVGVDLARERDSTVFTVIRRDVVPYRIVRVETYIHTPYTEMMGKLKILAEHFKPAVINVDQTSEKGWADLAIVAGVAITPVNFTMVEKEAMVNNLRVLFERKAISIPRANEILYTQIVHQQYETTIYGRRKFYHPTDEHDDALWSLALGAMALFVDTEDITEGINSEFNSTLAHTPLGAARLGHLPLKERDAITAAAFARELGAENAPAVTVGSASHGDIGYLKRRSEWWK